MKKEAEKKKNFWLNFIGIFLIVMGLIRIMQLILFVQPIHILWLCNHIIVLIGISILFRSSFWLTAEFIFLFFGQLVWVVVLLLFFIFGIVLPGNSAYLIYGTLEGLGFLNWVALLVHFLTLPLAFIAILLLNKEEKFAWKGSVLHGLVLVPFILFFGSFYNLNCFYKPCLEVIPNVPLYPLFVFITYFLILVIPLNYLVNWIIRKRNKK